MNKYIIKNCDAIYKHPVGHWNCANGIECQKREDCLLKQIVEYCLDQNLKYDTTSCDILNILDIREVE